MGETYIETYLGCDIYYLTPPTVPSAVYSSPCVVGHYFEKGAVKKRICEGQGGTWTWNEARTDGTCSFEPEPGVDPLEAAIKIAGSTAVGLILIMYSLS